MRWRNAIEPHLFLSPQNWSSRPRSCFLEHRGRSRWLLSFNESRHSRGLSHGNNCETPFHFGRINNRNAENVGRAYRFPLVIFSRPWVTDTRPINASGDAWQNQAIAFINTNGGSPRARRGVLQWGCVSRREGWFAAAMVAAAWLRFSVIDRNERLHVCGTKRVRAKRFRGKKCSRRARQSGRGSNGIRKFNPSVCGFFAIGGRPVEFVGGLTTGFADGTFARSYIVSHIVRPLSSLR